MKAVLPAIFLAPCLLAAQAVTKVEKDEMTGKTNAYAAWISDSLDEHFGSFQAQLMVRCRNGKLDAILSSPGNSLGEQQNKDVVQRAFERESRGEITIKVKVDTTSRIENWSVSLQNDVVVFRSGVWPGVIDRTKDVAKRILAAQDYLLVRYVTIWGTELTPRFSLGQMETRTSALDTVFSTCGKHLP